MGIYLIEAGGCICYKLSFSLVIARNKIDELIKDFCCSFNTIKIQVTCAKFDGIESETRVEINEFIKQMAIK